MNDITIEKAWIHHPLNVCDGYWVVLVNDDEQPLWFDNGRDADEYADKLREELGSVLA